MLFCGARPYASAPHLTGCCPVQVFEPAPPNTRKAILATNIAETSITISGVKYVIDTGFVKSRGYNAKLGADSLQVGFVLLVCITAFGTSADSPLFVVCCTMHLTTQKQIVNPLNTKALDLEYPTTCWLVAYCPSILFVLVFMFILGVYAPARTHVLTMCLCSGRWCPSPRPRPGSAVVVLVSANLWPCCHTNHAYLSGHPENHNN